MYVYMYVYIYICIHICGIYICGVSCCDMLVQHVEPWSKTVFVCSG